MTPTEFKQRWTRDEQITCPILPVHLAALGLQPATVDFLTQSGLPEDAAPFLTFVADTEQPHRELLRLSDLMSDLGPAFSHYVHIGYDSVGNILVLNTAENDRVEMLDHDQGFRAKFMNTSLYELAATLLAYRDFIDTALTENGEKAYLEGIFSEAHWQSLHDQISRIDAPAAASGFWQEELAMLVEHRQPAGEKPWWKFW